jgi:hypothetical protein
MTQPIFPKRRSDGSFCIEVSLRIESKAPADLKARVTRWLEDWPAANASRRWFREEVRYSDQFTGPPFDADCHDGSLSFKIEGRPAAKWWKDLLLIGLVKDLHDAFPEVTGVEHITDCAS